VFMSLWNHYRNLIRYPRPAARTIPSASAPRSHAARRTSDSSGGTGSRAVGSSGSVRGIPSGRTCATHERWEWRHLHNVRFIHYNDLLTRPREEIAGLAQYLNVDTTPGDVARVAEAVTFRAMRERADRLLPAGLALFRGPIDVLLQGRQRPLARRPLHRRPGTLSRGGST
jgi:hypothetical protein